MQYTASQNVWINSAIAFVASKQSHAARVIDNPNISTQHRNLHEFAYYHAVWKFTPLNCSISKFEWKHLSICVVQSLSNFIVVSTAIAELYRTISRSHIVHSTGTDNLSSTLFWVLVTINYPHIVDAIDTAANHTPHNGCYHINYNRERVQCHASIDRTTQHLENVQFFCSDQIEIIHIRQRADIFNTLLAFEHVARCT